MSIDPQGEERGPEEQPERREGAEVGAGAPESATPQAGSAESAESAEGGDGQADAGEAGGTGGADVEELDDRWIEGVDEDDEESDEDVEPLELNDEEERPEELEFHWYILKVQVNREDSICEALWRRARIHNVADYFRNIIVPTEEVVEFTKAGKRRIVKKKLFPGYIMVEMAITEETWFLVRETGGIGDFTGAAGKPTPMDPREVEKIIRPAGAETEGTQPRPAIPFKSGDRVRVKEGHFQNFEGDIETVDQTHGVVTVMINIFGRPVPVELKHWQVESV